MAKAMIRQKEGIVKPQVVAGREFKGTSFISKPERIVFQVSIEAKFGICLRVSSTKEVQWLTLI